ncbi:MAG: enoyl-CoA hydratase/isomerase family protein, partial [Halobacteriales archaeon]|nr:enoyl-CoA hydratase/isomerase family protein [Halobacteriales archaeon]
MPESAIRVEESVEHATVTIDRPEKLNALTASAFADLKEAFDSFATGEPPSVVILQGAGGNFSAGVDVSGVPAWVEEGPRAVRSALTGVHDALRAIEALDIPVVAAIEGYCLGGGLELAVACDLRIARADATLGLPEVNLGLAMDLGGAQKLPGMIGEGRTKELIMTGESIDGERAHAIGLVERVAPAARFDEAVSTLAETLAEKPTYVM